MAVDFFLKLDGVPGEATDAKHKDEIDVLSWSWGESNSGSSATLGGAGSGKVNWEDFRFNMYVNKATPALLLACATGKHIASAVLTCRKAGEEQHEYLKIKFTDILISSYQTSAGGGEELPHESCSFNYSKMEYQYAPQKPDGTLDAYMKMGYNLKENQKV